MARGQFTNTLDHATRIVIDADWFTDEITVGLTSSMNRLTIRNGWTVGASNLTAGAGGAASNNMVDVVGVRRRNRGIRISSFVVDRAAVPHGNKFADPVRGLYAHGHALLRRPLAGLLQIAPVALPCRLRHFLPFGRVFGKSFMPLGMGTDSTDDERDC